MLDFNLETDVLLYPVSQLKRALSLLYCLILDARIIP